MILFAIIVCTIIAFVCFSIYFDDECPRVILGYNCKGDHCDHSDEAVRDAHWTMGSYSKYDY